MHGSLALRGRVSQEHGTTLVAMAGEQVDDLKGTLMDSAVCCDEFEKRTDGLWYVMARRTSIVMPHRSVMAEGQCRVQ